METKKKLITCLDTKINIYIIALKYIYYLPYYRNFKAKLHNIAALYSNRMICIARKSFFSRLQVRSQFNTRTDEILHPLTAFGVNMTPRPFTAIEYSV